MSKRLTHTKNYSKQDLEALLHKALNLVKTEGASKSPTPYKKIIQIAKDLNEGKIYGKGLLLIIWYHMSRRQLNIALNYISEGLVLSKKLNVEEWLPKLYNWSGFIHKAKGDFSNAIDYYEMEIDINTKLNLEEDNFVAYSVLGNIYEHLENNQIAESYYLKAKQIASKYPNHREVINNYPQLNLSLVCLLIESNRYNEAETLCLEIIEFINRHKTTSRSSIAYTYDNLALIKHATNNYQESIAYILKAEKFPIKEHKELLFSLAKLKAYNFEALGNIQSAIVNYKKAIKILEKTEGFYARKLELLKKAKNFFDNQSMIKDAAIAQLLMDKVEAELQTLHAKLKLRHKSSVSYENPKGQNAENSLSLPTIHNGIVKININTINACFTENKSDKNVSKILLSEPADELRTRKSLKSLYEIINHENFVWINKNAFINKAQVSNWEQVAQKGIVNIAGKNFSISRSKRKELFNKQNITQSNFD